MVFIKSNKKKARIVVAFFLSVMMFVMCSSVVLASSGDGSDFDGRVSLAALGKAQSIYEPIVKYIAVIFTPTAVVAVGFCVAGMMFSFGGKSAEAYYAWMKKIFIAWVCFSCLKAIIQLLFSLAMNAA